MCADLLQSSGVVTGEPDYNHLEYFKRVGIPPPGALYLTRDDIILIQGWSVTGSAVCRIDFRVLAPNGTVQVQSYDLTVITTNTLPTEKRITNQEGFLLSATVDAPLVIRGDCYIKMTVKRGLGSRDVTAGVCFLAGYPSTTDTLAFPQGRVESFAYQQGKPTFVTVGAPGAGSDFQQQVDDNQRWYIRSVHATFTASATVANRFIVLRFWDGFLSTYCDCPLSVAITAGQVVSVNWFAGAVALSVGGVASAPLPNDFLFPTGFIIQSITAGLDGTDNWTGISMWVEKFLGT